MQQAEAQYADLAARRMKSDAMGNSGDACSGMRSLHDRLCATLWVVVAVCTPRVTTRPLDRPRLTNYRRLLPRSSCGRIPYRQCSGGDGRAEVPFT